MIKLTSKKEFVLSRSVIPKPESVPESHGEIVKTQIMGPPRPQIFDSKISVRV